MENLSELYKSKKYLFRIQRDNMSLIGLCCDSDYKYRGVHIYIDTCDGKRTSVKDYLGVSKMSDIIIETKIHEISINQYNIYIYCLDQDTLLLEHVES